MKKLKSLILLISFIFAAGCEQEVINLKQPAGPVTPPPPTAGTADFSKYVAIGTSISAGFQAGALFTDGQNESLGAILATQFAGVNSNAAFNQPTIGSVNGFNSTFSNPGAGISRGRLILFDPDGPGSDGLCPTLSRSAGPQPSAYPGATNPCTAVITPALPSPYNSAQTFTQVVTPVTGSFNNFSVPGIVLAQILTPATGGPLPPAANPAFNPYYRRFASNASNDGSTGSTILGDAITAAPTFFTFELGYNEVVGFATRGGLGVNTVPTAGASFSGQLNAVFSGPLPPGLTPILLASATSKGVIANVPDVTKLPFFSLVAWNSIDFKSCDPATAPTIAALNAATAYGAYNTGLDQALAGGYPGLTAEEVAKRKITFAAGKNGIVIMDETLTDLTPANAALVSMRQATAADKITLSAGAILGTRADCANPSSVYGVSLPLADQFVLLPSEITAITNAITAYNAAIALLVTNNPTRLALADLHTAFNTWVAGGAVLANGIPVLPSITPPLAGFSEDAVHPNGKGTAIFANVFIDAINAAFGATLDKADVTKYKGTRTPVNP